MDAVRIEDGRQVTLKKVLPDEGPYELSITEFFSSPGLKEDPRNHCVPLLELIDLSPDKPDGEKLIVMPFLRPFNNPRFQTYGEFVAFFMQISEVGSSVIEHISEMVADIFWSGPQVHAREESSARVGMHLCRKEPVLRDFSGIARGKTSCSIRLGCIPRVAILYNWIGAWISRKEPNDSAGRSARPATISSTLACPVNTPHWMCSTNQYAAVTSLHLNIGGAGGATHFTRTSITLAFFFVIVLLGYD